VPGAEKVDKQDMLGGLWIIATESHCGIGEVVPGFSAVLDGGEQSGIFEQSHLFADAAAVDEQLSGDFCGVDGGGVPTEEFDDLLLEGGEAVELFLSAGGEVIREFQEWIDEVVEGLWCQEAAEHDGGTVIAAGQIVDGCDAVAGIGCMEKLEEVGLVVEGGDFGEQFVGLCGGQWLEWDLLKEAEEGFATISDGGEQGWGCCDQAGEGMFLEQGPELVLTVFADPIEEPLEVFGEDHQFSAVEADGESLGEDFGDFGGRLIKQVIEPFCGVFVGIGVAERAVDVCEESGE